MFFWHFGYGESNLLTLAEGVNRKIWTCHQSCIFLCALLMSSCLPLCMQGTAPAPLSTTTFGGSIQTCCLLAGKNRIVAPFRGTASRYVAEHVPPTAPPRQRHHAVNQVRCVQSPSYFSVTPTFVVRERCLWSYLTHALVVLAMYDCIPVTFWCCCCCCLFLYLSLARYVYAVVICQFYRVNCLLFW